MKHNDVIDEIKFSKWQALWLAVFILALFTPVTDLIRQGIINRDYRWFILFFFVSAYIIWNYIRPTVFMLFGIPAIVITRDYISLSEKGYDIEWKDIEAVDLVDISSAKTVAYRLVITVKDPWKYISTIKNPVMRNFRWFAKDYFYKPFAVNLSEVEGNSQDVYSNIESYFHQYRGLSS